MLKKLLASALAVATVASCAYVPSALASAATVEYHTADVVKYMDWKLNTPDAPSTNVDVNIYVNTNVTGANGVYTLNVAPEKNNEADVKAALNDAKKGADKLKDAIGEIKETEAAVKTVVEYFYPAGTNTYVASIARKRAVVYSTWNAGLNTAIEDVKAKTLSDNDIKLLGYYNDDATGMPSALAEITQAKYISEVKLAGYAFKNWTYTQGANKAVSYIAPVFDVVAAGNIYYDAVSIKCANGVGNGYNAGMLVAGTYANRTDYVGNVLVPKADSANWATYVSNYVKNCIVNGNITRSAFNFTPAGATEAMTYTATNTFRKVADKTYAVTYAQDNSGAAGVNVTYTLNLRYAAYGNVPANDSLANFSAVKNYASESAVNWTVDPAEMYAIIKSVGTDVDADRDTLDKWLNKGSENDAGATIYALTKNIYSVTTNKAGHQVLVDVFVDVLDQYSVYSYGANDTLKEGKVYLTYADAKNDGQYKNQDDTTQVVAKNVTKATAQQLGVATSATIKGVPAEYAYAQTDLVNHIINCTYKAGASIGVELADFQTATGEFQTEPYFGRDAKVGDQVTLKVSLSDAGVAKKLDLTKVTVEFAAAGVATVSENFDYAATEFPAGVATTLTLAQGTNIVTATVYYDGAKVGTFAPFYAYVG